MYKEKVNCICCNSVNLIQVLDIKDQPLANSYHVINENLDKSKKIDVNKYSYD